MNNKILEQYGFHFPQSGIATNAAEAVRIASKIGFPVAMKISSPDILHKVDVGGVRLGLYTPDQVQTVFAEILENIRFQAPKALINGVQLEEMCSGGIEIFIGLINDIQFGPSITFGLGGTLIEMLNDVSYRVLPIERADAESMLNEIKARKILDGYRGLPNVSHPMLVDLILKVARLGKDLGQTLDAVDLNPIMVWENDYRVLDVKVLLNEQEKPVLDAQPNIRHLDKFFNAQSVALVGASDTPGKIGNCVFDSLIHHEYRGRVYPVNPERSDVMGVMTFPTITSLPEIVDLVIVTVALKLVPELLTQCAQKGIHNMVIISGGGKELGESNRELETTISRMSRELDVRIIGPNCIGTFDGNSRLDTFFQVAERLTRPPNGPLAVVTQSGTVGGALLEMAERLGVSKQVSYGNRADVDESDLIAYLATDNETKVIACYLEGLADGHKFMEALRSVGEKKPVLIFKAGRSKDGARVSMSHTGFFGGSYELFAGAVSQTHGVLLDSIEELYAGSLAVALQPLARGRRVAMISNGAGVMIQAIDLLPNYELEMASLSQETLTKLRQSYPPFYIVQNPIDVTGSATSGDYQRGIEALLQDPNVDIVMPWFVFQDTPLEETITEMLADLSRRYHKPILCGTMGGAYTIKMCRAIEAAGVPIFLTVREWVAAAKATAYGRK